MWRERNERGVPGAPPCDTCRVDLLPENEVAGNIYLETRGQVLTAGMGQVVDINHLAVEAAVRRRRVPLKMRQRVFEQVVRVFHHFLKEGEEAGGEDAGV